MKDPRGHARRVYALPSKTLGLPARLFLEERGNTNMALDVEAHGIPLGDLTVCPMCRTPIYWLRHARTHAVAALEAEGQRFGPDGANSNTCAIRREQGDYSPLSEHEKFGFHMAWPERMLYRLHAKQCANSAGLRRWMADKVFVG